MVHCNIAYMITVVISAILPGTNSSVVSHGQDSMLSWCLVHGVPVMQFTDGCMSLVGMLFGAYWCNIQ